MSKPLRDAHGRFVPKGPSQGHPKGPSQGHPDDASASRNEREDSDSDMELEFLESCSDASSTTLELRRQARKRAYLKQGSGNSSDSGKGKPKRKAKGKGKTLTTPVVVATTHNVGLEDAQRALSLERRAQLQQELEERVAAKEQQVRAARAKAGYGASRVLYADHSIAELERMAQEDQQEIVEVASKSSNLKGTFQKALKCRAASLSGIVSELVQRTATDETQQLQAKVDRLQAEVSQLHQKLAEATARPSQAPVAPAAVASPSNLEDIIRKVVMEERAFTRACFAGIEDRLLPERRLRPPLAADKTPSRPGPSSALVSVLPAADPTPTEPPPASKPSKGKGRGKKTRAATPVPSTSTAIEVEPAATPAAAHDLQREDALLPSTTPSNQSWTEVVRRGKRTPKTVRPAATPVSTASGQSLATGKGGRRGGGKKSAPTPSAAAPAAKRAPAGGRKLIPPKTAAVVVTLTPEAAERGETYESVLRRARTNADPTQLGIGAITCRRTATGARIFEFPGAQRGAHADLFATKLQEVIADAAKVVRPTKSATLEVTDLDDSVTKEDVVAAVAAAGGCDTAAVQGRAIRVGRGGMGTICLECPVAAAKAVLAKGRLRVGLSSGGVRVLEDQPLRCYKCFGLGHTRALCPSQEDRGEACYRCGSSEHKVASCKAAKPRCAVCAASGRPADHVMRGRNCKPPQKRGKVPTPTRPGTAAAAAEAPNAPAAANEVCAMNTD